jgi:hypothetical protein
MRADKGILFAEMSMVAGDDGKRAGLADAGLTGGTVNTAVSGA